MSDCKKKNAILEIVENKIKEMSTAQTYKLIIHILVVIWFDYIRLGVCFYHHLS